MTLTLKEVVSMYREIATKLVAAIQDGVFTVKLPTEAQLMERYHASRNTIRKAIDLIYQQGLLRRVQGSGYYITNTISSYNIKRSSTCRLAHSSIVICIHAT